jgi:hypothetical protein
MTSVAAWRDGLRRVIRAPWLTVGVWLGTLLTALPLALVLRRAIETHLGDSIAAETAASGVNFDWWNEFLAQAGGVAATFVPSILGFAAVLRNLSTVADAQGLQVAIAAAVAGHVLLSLFLLGGVLDRLARNRPTGSYGFFGACGAFVFRFVRLGTLAALVYGGLFVWLHPWLFDDVYADATQNITVERTAFLYRAALYAVFAVLLAAVNVLFDYAKVRMVVEDRRSAVGALAASARFLRRSPGAVVLLYGVNTLSFLLLIGVYAVVAPGSVEGWWVVPAFAVAQLFIVGRVVIRLLFAASQIALFQSRLAHAGYVAAPVPRWPDSAAAEAIRPPS